IAALKDGGTQPNGARRGLRLRSALVSAQVAVGFALVTSAGLLLESLHQLYDANLGYQHADKVLALDVCCNFTREREAEDAQRIFKAILDRAVALPGARQVAITDGVPLSSITPMDATLHIEGQPPVDPARAPRVDVRAVSDDYFSLLGIPVLSGRAFGAADGRDARPVAAINQTMARMWGTRNPIGTTFVVGETGPDGKAPPRLTVVAVVGDVRQFAVDSPASAVFYTPMLQSGFFHGRVLIRTDGDPGQLAAGLRAIVHAVDAEVPVSDVQTLEALRENRLTTPRLGAVLLAVFAGVALLITLAGLGAVVATTVSQRSREFGLRMALGASRRSVLGMVVTQGVWMLGPGLVLGLGGAVLCGRALESDLYQTPPTQPLVYGVVAALFVIAGLLACLGPARRAISIDPLLALRSE
ncbi:MAG TPA: FtsX-like permease family protein, partial [Vicinamibacterales bacterium]